MSDPSLSQTGIVGALMHGLTVLDMFNRERTTITVAEMAQRLELHRSNASRIAKTLAIADYLRPTGEAGRYRLSPKLVGMGQLALSQTDLAEAAAQPMADLVRDLGETAHLGILDGHSALTISVVDGWHSVRMHSYAGKRTPAHRSALGKVMLASLTDEQCEQLYGTTRPDGLAKSSMPSMPALRRQLAAIRAAGYALDDEEVEVAVRCVAGPVFNALGNVVGSISISGPTSRISNEGLDDIARQVLRVAKQASDNLGAPAVVEGWPSLASGSWAPQAIEKAKKRSAA